MILKSKRILIIDDEIDIQIVVREFLQDVGAQVEIGSNGREGLELAKSKTFDLILLDMYLPDMNGMAVMANLKKQGLRTPVYAFSALDDCYLNKTKLLASGFSGSVSKNFISNPIEHFPKTLAEIFSDLDSQAVMEAERETASLR